MPGLCRVRFIPKHGGGGSTQQAAATDGVRASDTPGASPAAVPIIALDQGILTETAVSTLTTPFALAIDSALGRDTLTPGSRDLSLELAVEAALAGEDGAAGGGAFATIAYRQGTYNGSEAPVPSIAATYPFHPTVGSLLTAIICCAADHDALTAPGSVTDSTGQTWVRAAESVLVNPITGPAFIAIYYLENQPTPQEEPDLPYTVTAQFDGGSYPLAALMLCEYTGVRTSDTLADANAHTDDLPQYAITTGPVTSIEAGDLALCACFNIGSGSCGTITPGANLPWQVRVEDWAGYLHGMVMDALVPDASLYDGRWMWSIAQQPIATIAVFRPAPLGPPQGRDEARVLDAAQAFGPVPVEATESARTTDIATPQVGGGQIVPVTATEAGRPGENAAAVAVGRPIRADGAKGGDTATATVTTPPSGGGPATPVGRPIFDEAYGSGDGSVGPYSYTTFWTPVTPYSIVIVAGAQRVFDNGAGILRQGSTVDDSAPVDVGTIDYETGACVVTFRSAVGVGVPITIQYES